MLLECMGGIPGKDWRARFMRLELIPAVVSKGFALPWSFPPSCIYSSTDFYMSCPYIECLILKVSITGTEQNYAIRGIIN